MGGAGELTGHRGADFEPHSVTDWRLATITVRDDVDSETEDIADLSVDIEGNHVSLALSGGRLYSASSNRIQGTSSSSNLRYAIAAA